MASTIKVDQIQLSDGSTPTAADLGLDNVAGSVINVVRYEYSGAQISIGSGAGSTLWQTPSYTPKSSTSKIIYESSVVITGDCDNDSHSVYGQTQYYAGVGGAETLKYESQSNALIDRGGHSRTRSSYYATEITGHGGQDTYLRIYASSTSSSNRNMLTMNPSYAPSTVILYEIAQ